MASFARPAGWVERVNAMLAEEELGRLRSCIRRSRPFARRCPVAADGSAAELGINATRSVAAKKAIACGKGTQPVNLARFKMWAARIIDACAWRGTALGKKKRAGSPPVLGSKTGVHSLLIRREGQPMRTMRPSGPEIPHS
jgi:hypothetical protein